MTATTDRPYYSADRVRVAHLDHRPSHTPARVQAVYEGWDDGGYSSPGAPAGVIVPQWSGAEAAALQEALRLTNEGYADKLGMHPRSIAGWRARPDANLSRTSQDILDTALKLASPEERERFLHLTRPDQARNPRTPTPLTRPATATPTTSATATAADTATPSLDAARMETSNDASPSATRDEIAVPAVAQAHRDPLDDARTAVDQLQARATRQRAAQQARAAAEEERRTVHQRWHTHDQRAAADHTDDATVAA